MSRKEPHSGEGELQDFAFPVEELIQAREDAALTQQDVAQELRLSLRYIQAIETAEFDQLPSLVFARGYIQSYTKLLNLDVQRYLAVFDELTVPGGKQRRRPIRAIGKVDEQAKSGDFAVRSFTWVFVLALIGVSVWWWKTQSNPQLLADFWPANNAEQAAEIVPADGDNNLQLNIEAEPEVDSFPPVEVDPANVPVTEQADEVLASAEAVLQEAEEVVLQATAEADSQVNEVLPITAETSEPVTPEPVEAAQDEVALGVAGQSVPGVSGMGRLLIDFADDCWISVKDVNGEVLAMRIKPAGSRLDVSGPGPLKIQIGKVSAVQNVTFNGESVDLARYTRLDVAKLSLPASE